MGPGPNRFEPPKSHVEDGPTDLEAQRPRYLRGTLASLVLGLPWLALMWGVHGELAVDPTEATSHNARLLLAGALLYAGVHVVGNSVISRALARRRRLHFWPFVMVVGLLPLAIAIVAVPAWVLLVDHTVVGYQRCPVGACHAATSLAAALLVYVVTVVPGMVTSLAWYAFGRPRRAAADASP